MHRLVCVYAGRYVIRSFSVQRNSNTQSSFKLLDACNKQGAPGAQKVWSSPLTYRSEVRISPGAEFTMLHDTVFFSGGSLWILFLCEHFRWPFKYMSECVHHSMPNAMAFTSRSHAVRCTSFNERNDFYVSPTRRSLYIIQWTQCFFFVFDFLTARSHYVRCASFN